MRTRRSACVLNTLSDDALLCILERLEPSCLRLAGLVCMAWRQHAKRLGLLVHLVGSTPGGRHARFLGSYILRDELVHNRPSYVQLGDPGKMVWYDGDGCWFAGIASEVGQDRGRLLAEDYAHVPWLCTSPWEISRGLGCGDEPPLSSWDAAPGVSCGIDPDCEEAAKELALGASRELNAASATVHIVSEGAALSPLHNKFMGAYSRVPGARSPTRQATHPSLTSRRLIAP